ncbi:S8 family peptidase, partial [Yoonia sp. R2-816]|uniref:S8 family peptidase n=1 Tax=Yoonia sp. R2-816 TaxID=3342638 RepID=UPI00372AFE50
MRLFKKLVLITTTIVALATSASANIYAGQLSSYPDQQVLQFLVSEHARDPSTFADAQEYIILSRPGILEEYLSQTLDRAPDTRRFSFSEPSAGETSGAGSMIVLGIVGMAVALSLADDGGEESRGPNPLPSLKPRPTDPITDPDSGPNDPAYYQTREFKENYGLGLIGADVRYAKGGQGEGIKIAILDTGIDVDHPDVFGKIDLHNSYSYFGNFRNISDTGGHGTHVAGIAAGRKDGRGTHGVAFEAELLIFKGIPGDNTEFSTIPNVWADAINRSIDADADVMNNSWSYVDGNRVTIPITDFEDRSDLEAQFGTATIKAWTEALDEAVTHGLMSIFAAGNDGLPEVSVTAGLPVLLTDYKDHFIAVVAVDEDKNIARFNQRQSSNRCGVAMHFCLAAPGLGIPSARNGDIAGRNPVSYNGTSMAAPHVAGGYALLKSQWPDLKAPVIAQIMFAAADDLGDPGVDAIYGHGLLNLERAMRPIGELVVYQGSTTESDAMPLAETGIVASGALA